MSLRQFDYSSACFATPSPVNDGKGICGEQSLLQQLVTHEIVTKNALQSSDFKIQLALKNVPNFDLLLVQGIGQTTGFIYVRAWFAQHVHILLSALQIHTIYVYII
jgi:hypothetical protein